MYRCKLIDSVGYTSRKKTYPICIFRSQALDFVFDLQNVTPNHPVVTQPIPLSVIKTKSLGALKNVKTLIMDSRMKKTIVMYVRAMTALRPASTLA